MSGADFVKAFLDKGRCEAILVLGGSGINSYFSFNFSHK